MNKHLKVNKKVDGFSFIKVARNVAQVMGEGGWTRGRANIVN